jgi:Na+/proline symporter
VDENEEKLELKRQIAAKKEIISHLFDKSHQYVTGIIAGAFAAYFATLGALADRFTDTELRISALLMTMSLTVFVMWEVLNMIFVGHHSFKGDYGTLTETPPWAHKGWYVVMVLTLGTALPAIALSIFVYLRGLGALSF